MKKIALLLILMMNIAWAQDSVDVIPKFSGYSRSWYQSDFSTNQGQFLVKEARLTVLGNVNQYAGYKMQVDFTRLGSLTTTSTTINGQKVVTSASANFSDVLLDAIAIINPTKELSFSAGQFVVPISSENLTSGVDLNFINRGLITNITPDLRDIGFSAAYATKSVIPFELRGALLNGSGQNKTENDKTTNYVLRGVVQPLKGLGVSGNYYGGTLSGCKVKIIDFQADYKIGQVLFNGEFGERRSTLNSTETTSNTFFIYSVYDLAFGNSFISHIMPAVRYENYDPSSRISMDKLDKYTAGVAFEFAKIKYAQFRINYEKFNYQGGKTNPNKLIVELLTRF
jgi:hypothetical protein